MGERRTKLRNSEVNFKIKNKNVMDDQTLCPGKAEQVVEGSEYLKMTFARHEGTNLVKRDMVTYKKKAWTRGFKLDIIVKLMCDFEFNLGQYNTGPHLF